MSACQGLVGERQSPVAEAVRVEGPAAYVIPGDTPRPNEAADLVNLLRRNGIEVHTADRELGVKDHKFPAGSYIVRMDQPYSRMADMLLDTQFYSVTDPQPYDDTGWTLGALCNVATVRITEKSALTAPLPAKDPAKPDEEPITDIQRLFYGVYIVPPELRPRVILRFAAEEKNLLVSGMLAGGSELVNRPAIVDVPAGKGHVVLFANNPMWRHQTQGSFCLLLNAILNYDHLDAGRAQPLPHR